MNKHFPISFDVYNGAALVSRHSVESAEVEAELLATFRRVYGGNLRVKNRVEFRRDDAGAGLVYNVPDVEDGPDVPVTVRLFGDGIGFGIPGYGDKETADEFGTPVVLEFVSGSPRLIVWTDITDADPQIIDLTGAALALREPEPA